MRMNPYIFISDIFAFTHAMHTVKFDTFDDFILCVHVGLGLYHTTQHDGSQNDSLQAAVYLSK